MKSKGAPTLHKILQSKLGSRKGSGHLFRKTPKVSVRFVKGDGSKPAGEVDVVALRENTPEIIGKSRSRSARVRTFLLEVLIFFLCSSTYPGGHKPYLKIRQASQVKCGPIFWLRQEPAKLIPTELGSVQQQYFYTFDVLSCLILFNFQFHACNSKLKVSKLLPAPAFVRQKIQ